MARIDALPAVTTIMGLKGKLDYYLWRGIPCVRTWPRSKYGPRAPLVQASAANMTDYVHRLNNQTPILVAAGRELTFGSAWTWRDATISAAWGHITPP